MIHDDNQDARKKRRASAGRDGNVKTGPGYFWPPVQASEPRRDVDSLEKRVEDLERRQDVVEAFCERVRECLRSKGYDFDDAPPPAEAST